MEGIIQVMNLCKTYQSGPNRVDVLRSILPQTFLPYNRNVNR